MDADPVEAEDGVRIRLLRRGVPMKTGSQHREESREKMRAAKGRRTRTRDGRRQCLRCKEWFPATYEFFHRSGAGGEFLHSYCKPCANIINKANRDRRPDALLRENLKRRFGITPEDYDAMFEEQGGVCAICGSPPRGRRLSVDHDHDTDEVRGLLCSTCNAGIGSMRDDPELLRRAIAYLEAP